MVFHLVAVGRVRQAGLRQACDAYERRCARYFSFRVHELPEAKQANTSTGIQGEERDVVLRRVPKSARRVGLSRAGVSYTSRELAARIEHWREEARDVAFIVGGAYGLHEDVLSTCDELLALSTMTFPHELARLLLLEQIYRSGTLLRNEPYHKGD